MHYIVNDKNKNRNFTPKMHQNHWRLGLSWIKGPTSTSKEEGKGEEGKGDFGPSQCWKQIDAIDYENLIFQ